MAFTSPPTAVIGAVVDESYTDIFSANDNWFNGLLPAPTAANQVPLSTSTSAATWGKVDTAHLIDGQISGTRMGTGAVTAAKIPASAVTAAKLHSSVATALIPSGNVGSVRQAAEIPSGWSRETRLDGRMPVGAGTAFVTFSEDTDYGASWGHTHPVTASVGTPSATITDLKAGNETGASVNNHAVHTFSGNSDATSWQIPVRAIVFIRKS